MSQFRRNGVIALFASAVIMASLAWLSFGRITLFLFSKVYGFDISYDRLEKFTFDELKTAGFRITDKSSRAGLSAERASIRIKWRLPLFQDSVVDFDLNQVNFSRDKKDADFAYDTLDALAVVPFNSRWKYDWISGRAVLLKEGLRLENFSAAGSDIKLSLSGIIHRNNTIDFNMTVYFSDSLAGKIPNELSGIVLQDEGAKWKSLTVHLAGNYRTPSIQVLGRLFRLNINPVSP